LPKAVILGCAGPVLAGAEADFFRGADPLGFILFERNCRDPDQVRRLTADLKACVGRPDAPVLIDQEGGRVARLRPPHWRAAPAAGVICALAKSDLQSGIDAARLNARLIAAELADLGITVNCAPVLDVPRQGADPVIGDRAAGDTPDLAARLGRAACEGYLDGGVLPVIKHIPGHGRALVDSHKALPVVDAPLPELDVIDFSPFRDLSDMPVAMTAHVVYRAVDPDAPATLSADVIGGVIRGRIGFDGFLISDDLSMRALTGGLGDRTASALEAGCDAVLHCNGEPAEMRDVVAACPPLGDNARTRWERASVRRPAPGPFDEAAAVKRLAALLQGAPQP